MKKFILLAILSGALCLSASAENEALYFPNGEFFVPRANLLDHDGNTVRSYALYMRKYSGSWRFKLIGASPVSTPTNAASTNAAATTNLAGTWKFDFSYVNTYQFNGTNFYRTTNMATPVVIAVPLTLTQDGPDITGTGTTNSIQYSLSGQIAEDLFSFSMLAGYTNQTMSLISGHVAVTDDTLSGDFFANTNNGSFIDIGTVQGTKQ